MKNLTVKQYIENHRPELKLVAESADIVIVIEVPHQRRASSLLYFGEKEYKKRYLDSVVESDHSGGIADYANFSEIDEDSIEAIEGFAGHDLHSWRKLVGLDEVLDFVPTNHQRLEVWREITKDLLAAGVAEEIEAEEIEAEAE